MNDKISVGDVKRRLQEVAKQLYDLALNTDEKSLKAMRELPKEPINVAFFNDSEQWTFTLTLNIQKKQ